MVVVASVQNAPDPGSVPAYDEPTPTPLSLIHIYHTG